MELSIAQITLLSRLLDEALPLDAAGRRAWLEKLSPDHQDLAPALRDALLTDKYAATELERLATLPKLGSADETSGWSANGLQPGAQVGPYELIRSLGAGGMAEVWLARRADGAFRREVALKLPMRAQLRADLQPRFVRERDILASLEHPLIARLYDAGVGPEGLPYLAMEYVQGLALTDWCDQQRCDIRARLKLFQQVLEAVQYAHAKHVIHRDLKPSNILVTESGQVRLLDFGVAKLLESDEADQIPLTSVYGRALTPDYASPEMLRGEPIDERSDLYSLGILLYELLTGTRPYRLRSAASIGLLEQAIANLEVRRPSTQLEPAAATARAGTQEHLARQMRPDLDAMILKALAKDPAQRYPTVVAFAEDVRLYLDGRPIEARPAGFAYRVNKFVRRNAALVGVSAAASLAVVVAVGYALYRDSRVQATVAASSAVIAVPPRSRADVRAFTPLAHSVAVLPFLDMSEKRDQEYLSDGLAEELLDLLMKVPGLQVIARTSSFSFKGKTDDIPTIARKLNVANILEGSVRRSGNRLRVSAQLVSADTGVHIWSETYEREFKDVFKLQDEIAGAVVEQLKLKLIPGQLASSSHRTSNPEAYNRYLLGRQLADRGNRVADRLAIEAYRKAIALDPNYAAAYSGLAIAEYYVADEAGDVSGVQRALEAAYKAVALAPEEADGYAARGYLRFHVNWDWVGAQADLDKALSYEPGNGKVLSLYGALLSNLGRFPEALTMKKRATELDPLSSSAWAFLGIGLAWDRQFQAARQAIGRALEIQPNAVYGLNYLGTLQLLEGNAADALASFLKISDSVFREAGVAMSAHTLGRSQESQQAVDAMISHDANSAAYQIAAVYAWRGEKSQAFRWLERAYDQHDGGLAHIKIDPMLASLHGDPRFTAMMAKIKLPE